MAINVALSVIQEHLTAKKLADYISTLESISGKAGTLQSFVEQQSKQWNTAMQQLQPAAETPSVIAAILADRVQQLNIATNEQLQHVAVGTKPGWHKLVDILQRHVPAGTTTGYFIKPAVLREMLIAHPPQKIISHLGYPSIEACLDSEELFEILAALRFAETEAWMESYLKQYSALTAEQFEYRPVEFFMLDPAKWWTLAEAFAKTKKHHFSHLKEVGVIFSYPGPDQVNNSTVLHVFVMMVLHYMFEVKFYSNFFEQNIQRYDNFGSLFIEVLQGDKNMCASDSGYLPIIQQYHLKKPNPNPCVFEPHVMPEVLHWNKATVAFFSLMQNHPQYELFSFWNTCYTVAKVIAGELVTLNFSDNILSNDAPLVYHYKEALWNALFVEYFNETILEQAIIREFAHKVLNLNNLITLHYGKASS